MKECSEMETVSSKDFYILTWHFVDVQFNVFLLLRIIV